MFIQLFTLIIASVFLAGCATTRVKTDQDMMQSRIVDLEKKLEEKDAEIVNLQYEVKDLSSRVESVQSAPVAVEPVNVVSSNKGNDEVIRVNVDAITVQTALQNAGFYTGKIDGKVGAGTKAAISSFQKSKGLTADGIVGRRTWELLKDYAK